MLALNSANIIVIEYNFGCLGKNGKSRISWSSTLNNEIWRNDALRVYSFPPSRPFNNSLEETVTRLFDRYDVTVGWLVAEKDRDREREVRERLRGGEREI